MSAAEERGAEEAAPRKNLDLMRKVRDRIRAHPEQHYQGSWWEPDRYDAAVEASSPEDVLEYVDPAKDYACTSSACMAGWAVLLSGLPATVVADRFGDEWDEAGRKLLGLTYAEANALFYSSTPEAPKILDRMIAEAEAEAAIAG